MEIRANPSPYKSYYIVFTTENKLLLGREITQSSDLCLCKIHLSALFVQAQGSAFLRQATWVNIPIFKTHNWASILRPLQCTILLHPRNTMRNTSIYTSLSVTQCYLKAHSQSPWAVLQCRLHRHRTSPKQLAAAELKLLVETSTVRQKSLHTMNWSSKHHLL